MSRELLRRLPGVDTWLSSPQGTVLCAEYSREEVLAVMRAHLARLRERLKNAGGELPDLTGDTYTSLLRAELLERRASSLKPVINATGIVIHTNLGRAPLADEAVDAVAAVARGYSNLEYDLGTGERGSRTAHVTQPLRELTGAADALVVNNGAAALLLALRAHAGSGEVIVSRGELIEIGGSFRMPDVIAQSGARLVEVGTTNRTTLRDYADAITPATRVLLMSHPSNYRVVGFTARPETRELAALAGERGLVLIHDLGSGSLVPLPELGTSEPSVAECLRAGADLVTFSGDKLLVGPQAGIVVGRGELVDGLRRHAFARACRIDKLSLAALAATLALYRPPYNPRECVPVLRMLTESKAAIGRRAARVAKELGSLPDVTAS
ncbi:MAG TPA: L-seryl-tRNA(Sec) selenium transferase, partial [Gammaproteobacteria bacterium]|nr:L-seryl-tRNA(Sec) selenium transferase [Gammaproteobacteria bacterium]